MKRYNSLNNLTGWIIFLIAAYTYLSTLEPSASFWDCGEFISASYKLEVGHPPGAPFFLVVARIFTLFAGHNTERVAIMVNTLSGLASAFTILFLFWSITHLTRRILLKDNKEPSTADIIVILGSGMLGALAYTFSDTFWFSAVEGEVYGSSSLFTAVVFWAILKWENVADEKYANRWLIFIAYLMGLSIGVHLLNLLAIPAIVLIFYFRKYKVTTNGVLLALLASAGILGGIIYILIPGLIKFAAFFERFFVNNFHLPYFSGVFIYFGILFALVVYGIHYTHKHGKVLANTILLIFTVITIGYSSYTMIIIRSLANPPMDQNNPEDMFNLLSYLNREQYGERPLFYGQYFNTPITDEKEGKPVYVPENGKYTVITHKPEYVYDDAYKTLFPRMYSNQPDHIDAYIQWTNMDKSDLFEVRVDRSGNIVKDRYGEPVYDYNKPKKKPGFNKNIRFFIRYQLGYMYLRYFLWNFSGRQNDIQGTFKEDITSGNWITGLKFIDSARLGNQEKLTSAMKNNKARNTFFMLPLLLGLIGLFFQYREDKRNFWVVMALFFFTGIAIVIYLNQTPLQPRERDYAYAGSFYAFCIWIGFAVAALYKAAMKSDMKQISTYAVRGLITIVVLAIFDFASNGRLGFTWSGLMLLLFMLMLLLLVRLIGVSLKNEKILAILMVVLCLPVPLLMASEDWNDHDRSHRYIARDFASNYLNSCEKNAIIYTNGDNDTFPLWYAQEVEGIRTDVRVINLSYLSADWYIEQMSHKAYESEPVQMTLKEEQYQQGTRDIVYLYDMVPGYADLLQSIEFLANDNQQKQHLPAGIPRDIRYLPQHRFVLKADSAKVFNNGTIKPQMASRFTPQVKFQISQGYITKNHVMALDFLATNQWNRPICYAITVGSENYMGLDEYFENHGMAYRVIPAFTVDSIGYAGGINTDVMYDNIMNKFRWGGTDRGDVYLDENCLRMISNIRNIFGNLTTALIRQGKNDKARKVIEKCTELFPNDHIPYDLYMLTFVDSYYKLGETEKAEEMANLILDNSYEDISYFISLEKPFSNYLKYDKRVVAHILTELIRVSHFNGDKKFSASIQQRLEDYGDALKTIFR
jgi:tetratricopeptide (TPR) repeat protein